MMEKIKANLSYVLCAAMGLTHFILLAFRYISAFMKYNGEREAEKFCSGYGMMKLENFDGSELEGLAKFSGVLQILLLILAIGMIGYGVIGLLKAFGIFEQFPDNLGSMKSSRLADFALLGYGGLNVTIWMFMLMWCFINTDTYYGAKIGVCLGVGMWLTFFISTAAAVAPFLLPMMIPGLKEASSGAPRFEYHCTRCGQKAAANQGFCNSCGGSIAMEQIKQYNYVCGSCGKKMKKTDKFCNTCGGAVVAVEVKNYEYICGGCGKKMKKTDKFCNTCGGAIIQREIVPMAPAPAPAPVPAGHACPNCGNAMNPGAKFCNVCGASYAPAPAAPAAPVGRACPNCGQPVPEQNRFCNSCGTPVQ